MYKWPQGRVIRTIALVLVVVIALDLAYNGAWASLVPDYPDAKPQLRQAGFGYIYSALALGTLAAGVLAAGFHRLAVDFLIEVEQEMTRVTWPTGNELIRSTAVIAVMIVVLGASILAVDWFNLEILFKAIYGSGK
jgi:preprotein translocase SecE subunit